MRQLKRTAAAALAMGMFFTSVPYAVLADAPAGTTSASSITQDQAIEIAKKYIAIPEGYKLRNVSFHDAKDGQGPFGSGSVWMINFAKEDRYDYGYINLAVDANNGRLLNYDFSQREESALENAISREEARTKALQYLKRFAPDKADQVREAAVQDPVLYGPYGPQNVSQMFRFERVVDGIPFPANGISIRVNGKGELRGYSFNWSDDVTFPDIKASVTEEQAKEVYRNALHLQLQYQIIYKPYAYENRLAQLLYGPWQTFYGPGPMPMIDAVKGVAVGFDGNPVPAGAPVEFKPVADRPGEPKTTKDLTKEEALELVASYHLGLDGFILENSSYESINGSQHFWRFGYRKGDPKDGKNLQNASVSIDAKTGELREYMRWEYRGGPYEFPQKPAISADQARQEAIDFVKTAMPTKANQLALNPVMDPKMGFKTGPGYSFEFVRLVDGVPTREGGVRVGIDPDTGQVREFTGMGVWDEKLEFQPKTNVISRESALNKFVEKYPLRLQYVPIYAKGKTPYDPPAKPESVALVYAPEVNGPMQMLNAVTGEWVSPWGEKQPVEPAEIQDIKGHWAEKQLRYFVERGIFKVQNGKLEPDAGVTRGDMVRYMLLAVDGSRRTMEKSSFADVPKTDPNFDFIEEAAARKWIDRNVKNFRPGDIMTREELADLVTSALGYKKLSEAKDTFKNHYSDVDSDGQYMGDVAIVAGLGIMTGWEGRFMPKDPVTKAQAAVVLTKMLDQLREKQGYPYYISK